MTPYVPHFPPLASEFLNDEQLIGYCEQVNQHKDRQIAPDVMARLCELSETYLELNNVTGIERKTVDYMCRRARFKKYKSNQAEFNDVRFSHLVVIPKVYS